MSFEYILKLEAFIGKSKRRGTGYCKDVIVYHARRQLYALKHLLAGRSGHDRDFDVLHASIFRDKSSVSGIAEYFDRRSHSVFHFTSENIEKIVSGIPDELKEKTIQVADLVINRRFSFRNISVAVSAGEIDWCATPQNNMSWLWDMNRHRYFLDLASASFYTGEKKYMDDVVALWQQWIQSNPPCKTVNWKSPFEVAARLNNWIWLFFYMTSSPYAPDLPLATFLRSMYHHAVYLFHNLELHWPNNHLFLESKALLSFCLMFPEYDPDQRFFKRAESVFNRELATQILPDGCHSELCSMYHRVVTGELYELVTLLKRNNMQCFREAGLKVDKMVTFSEELLRGDGSAPLTGDSAADDNYIRFQPEKREKTDLNYWLNAGGPAVQPSVSECLDSPRMRVFPHGGYAFISDHEAGQQLNLLFDCGEFSRNPATDHAHCDALSFDLHACGRPLFVDPGVYYHPQGKPLYQYLRSTAAHNTLMIDEREQSWLWRDSDVKSRASVRMLESVTPPGSLAIKAACMPYWGEEEGISHCREIIYNSFGKFKIIDRVDGANRHKLTWSFHFAPGIGVSCEKAQYVFGEDENGLRLFELECCNDGLGLQIINGREQPPLGWYSENSSTITAIYTALFSIDVELPYECEFNIRVNNNEEIKGL